MKHIKSIAFLFSALILLASCSKYKLKGEGSTTSETRSLSSFTSVQANGDVNIQIHSSNTNKVVITGYENLVPVYETYVRDNRLVLQFQDKYHNIRNNNIKVDVYVTELSGVRMNGSGKVNIWSGISGDLMEVEVNGSGDIYIGQNNYQTMRLNINGSGNIKAKDAVAEKVYANISGSGNIDVTVTHFLDARISGSGNINYWGNPEEVDTDVAGSGRVRKKS